MRSDRVLFALALLSPLACKMVTEGTGEWGSSSTGDTDGDSSGNDSITTTLDTSGVQSTADVGDTTDGSSTDSGSTDDGSSSEEGSSTGEPISDFALSFDGSSFARKIDDGDDYEWPSSDFTVEAWAEITDLDARGVIFDTTNANFSSGWVFYLHNEYHALVFSIFDDSHANHVVVGPSLEDIGTGWHHLAATKSGTSVYIFVDGTTMKVELVPSSIAFDNTTLWTLGGNAVDNVDFRLTDVTLDDVRISGFARYEGNFDPEEVYIDGEDAIILLLRLDAGSGVVTNDEIMNVGFSVEDPAWVAGNTER